MAVCRQYGIKTVIRPRHFFPFVLLLFLGSTTLAAGSTCYGSTANGRLEGGVELPASGRNYVTYSRMARLLGRTYVHATVRDVVLSAYNRLLSEMPNKVFKYAETGFEEGGRFPPHKTHQNGLSVDFMVPVVNEKGESVHLPTHWFNKFGYSIEFNAIGKYEGYTIDFEAMAAHIVSLHKSARKQGFDLWRVIFDPELQPFLLKTKYAEYLTKHIRFSDRRSWVRHDEHYHVDFKVPCVSLSGS